MQLSISCHPQPRPVSSHWLSRKIIITPADTSKTSALTLILLLPHYRSLLFFRTLKLGSRLLVSSASVVRPHRILTYCILFFLHFKQQSANRPKSTLHLEQMAYRSSLVLQVLLPRLISLVASRHGFLTGVCAIVVE